MQSIPNNLLKNINEENILLEKKVVEIGKQKDILFNDGQKWHTDNIVLTGRVEFSECAVWTIQFDKNVVPLITNLSRKRKVYSSLSLR